MKFPLQEDVFPRIQLSPQQCAEYEELTDRVIDEALDEYDVFNYQHKRQLSKLQWKPIKAREDITVYRERCVRGSSRSVPLSVSASRASTHDFTASGSAYDFTTSGSTYDITTSGRGGTGVPQLSPSASFSSASSASNNVSATPCAALANSSERGLPRLLAVGTMVGTVEDMVYGMSSPNPTYAQVKSAYTKDEIVDAKVLHEIKGPTPDDPLRFLGLKWLVKGHSNAIGAVVRPRDFVYVESMGVRTRANGSRVGYFVLHSVEHPACRELNDLSIVRARMSLCYLFKGIGGRIDVYLKSFVELNGNVTDSLAAKTVANSLISVGRALTSSHNRKIGWELTKRQLSGAVRTISPDNAKAKNCATCSRSFSKFSTILSCRLCSALLCSKCRDQRELTIPRIATSAISYSRTIKLVTRMAVNLCRTCVIHHKSQDTLQVATQEILAGMYGSVPTETKTHPVASPPHEKPSVLSPEVSSSELMETPPVSEQGPQPHTSEKQNESLTLPSSIIKQVSLQDIGAALLTTDSESTPSSFSSSSKILSQRGPRTISMDTVSSSNMSTEDLNDLVDMLVQSSSPSSTASDASVPTSASSSSVTPSRKKTLEIPEQSEADYYDDDDSEVHDFERKDSVIELKRDDGEWTHSARSNAALMSSTSSDSQELDLYARITELHQTAENVYQYAKRTTETVLIASSMAPPLSLLSSLALDDDIE